MKNQALRRLLSYTSTVHSLHKETKRGWAELFAMERKLARQQVLLKVCSVLVSGFLFGMLLNKIGF